MNCRASERLPVTHSPTYTSHTHTHSGWGREFRDGFICCEACRGGLWKGKERNTASRCALTRALCLLAGRVKRLTCRHESSSSRTPLREGAAHMPPRVNLRQSPKPFPACLLKIKIPPKSFTEWSYANKVFIFLRCQMMLMLKAMLNANNKMQLHV